MRDSTKYIRENISKNKPMKSTSVTITEEMYEFVNGRNVNLSMLVRDALTDLMADAARRDVLNAEKAKRKGTTRATTTKKKVG